VKRSELAHIIRSAATLSGERDIVVFGSQAILSAVGRRFVDSGNRTGNISGSLTGNRYGNTERYCNTG
jgi:hypothetical protein